VYATVVLVVYVKDKLFKLEEGLRFVDQEENPSDSCVVVDYCEEVVKTLVFGE